MTAGRELDALVAEKVFGVLAVHDSRDGYGKGARQYPAINGNPSGPVPFYSSDIACAWLVVEKMRRDGWAFTLLLTPPASSVIVPTAAFRQSVYPPDCRSIQEAGYSSHAESVPAAICLAALKAVGVEVEG